MKTVSASIVVLAGAIVLSVGSLIPHNDTQVTLQLIGGGVGVYGLIVWHREMQGPAGGGSSDGRDASNS